MATIEAQKEHKMNSSPTIANLAAALCKFQGMVAPSLKDGKNPHFNSRFATLDSIIETIRASLCECGLAISQPSQPTEPGLVAIETVLMHESGEWLSGVVVLPMTKLDPQQAGSAITYGRRYALAAMLGLSQTDDDAELHRTTETAKRPAPAKADPISDVRKDISALAMELGAIKHDGFDQPERRKRSYNKWLHVDSPKDCHDIALLIAYRDELQRRRDEAIGKANRAGEEDSIADCQDVVQ
jgi:hypothetical protein